MDTFRVQVLTNNDIGGCVPQSIRGKREQVIVSETMDEGTSDGLVSSHGMGSIGCLKEVKEENIHLGNGGISTRMGKDAGRLNQYDCSG